MAVQWLRLPTSTARGVGLIPGRGTKILQAAMRHGQKQRKKKKRKENSGEETNTQKRIPFSHTLITVTKEFFLASNLIPNCWGRTWFLLSCSHGVAAHFEIQQAIEKFAAQPRVEALSVPVV